MSKYTRSDTCNRDRGDSLITSYSQSQYPPHKVLLRQPLKPMVAQEREESDKH